MKIFLYYSGFGNTGGITNQIRSYASALIQADHEVTIGGLGRPWWHSAATEVTGALYVGGPYLPKRSWFRRLGLDLPEIKCARIVEHLRNHNYDIVHCLGWNNTNANIFWAGLTRGAKTLYTATFSGDKQYPDSFEKCGLLLNAVHGPANSIAKSIAHRMNIRGNYYVFPIAPVNIFDPVDTLPNNSLSIGFIGHLEAYKRVDKIVRVWKEVISHTPQAHLHFFGSGSSEVALKNASQHLGLQGNISFHGYQSDLVSVFSKVSCLIVMAKEGLSLAAVEALCAGRSLILPEDGCFPEVYGNCSAVTMFPPDAGDKQIAEVVVKTMTNGFDTASRKAARQYYEQYFSPRVVGEQLIACYEDLLSH